MKNHKDCPICKQELVSDIGPGCLMCGMPLENKLENFCSMKCKLSYIKINLKMMVVN